MAVRLGKYKIVTWRGVRLDKFSVRSLKWAQENAGFTFNPSQGSHNAGGVAASGGTHDGGGAVDISTRGLTAVQKRKLLKALKRAGWGAWLRTTDQGPWGEHIHAVQFANRKVSSGARAQLQSYDRGRNGLRDDGPDPTPWRSTVKRRFGFQADRPLKRK